MSGGRGEASEAAPTHDQEVEVLLLEEKKFRYKKKRGLEVLLLLYGTKNGYPNQRPRFHTPPFQHQHQHYICVLLSGFRSLNLRHFFLQNHRTI